MHIIALEAENYKRLKAIRIKPDESWQVIGGRNAQGKSSVLDAIWSALGGGKASPEKPIRDGEETALVRLDLGDLWVTRTWTQRGTSLKVESRDGATYRSPQAMLDDLIGHLGFDPLAFTRLKPRDQREELLRLVDLPVDVDALDARRAALYEERTTIGREAKAIGEITVDEKLPADETSASDLIDRIRKAQDGNTRRRFAEAEVKSWRAVVEDLEQQLSEARDSLGEAVRDLDVAPDIVNVAPLEADLATVEQRNAAIRANNIARERAAERDALLDEYKQRSEAIVDLDAQKASALAAAKFPVEGLGFDDVGVTYKGTPLAQASSAEQIEVSLAIGMALNPQLRVLMIKDGSLLDPDTLQAIREQVADKGFQVWVERVGDADEGAVVIEDGEAVA